LKLIPLIGALLLSATASNAQTAELDEMHQKARSFCIRNTDLCLFIQRRAEIMEMCGEIVLGNYNISDLNANIRREIRQTSWPFSNRLGAESAALNCENMGVKGIVVERN
jgi:hypothetical protein